MCNETGEMKWEGECHGNERCEMEWEGECHGNGRCEMGEESERLFGFPIWLAERSFSSLLCRECKGIPQVLSERIVASGSSIRRGCLLSHLPLLPPQLVRENHNTIKQPAFVRVHRLLRAPRIERMLQQRLGSSSNTG